MINLLPDEQKRDIRAGRANILLVRYNFLLLIAAGFLIVASIGVYTLLSMTKANSEATMTENAARVAEFNTVQKEAATFRTNLSTAKQILDKDVAYSQTIINIAQVMPPGTILSDLSLDVKTYGTPTTLSARAKTYDDAIRLKETLQLSGLFTDVNFKSITEETNEGGPPVQYPFDVILNVTFAKDPS